MWYGRLYDKEYARISDFLEYPNMTVIRAVIWWNDDGQRQQR